MQAIEVHLRELLIGGLEGVSVCREGRRAPRTQITRSNDTKRGVKTDELISILASGSTAVDVHALSDCLRA